MSNRWMVWLALGLAACGGDGGSGGGGAAGPGGGGGGDGGGGGGDAVETGPLRLVDPSFRVVAAYGADGSFAYVPPSWGKHGGLLSTARGPSSSAGWNFIEIVRWHLPEGSEGELERQAFRSNYTIPNDWFFGPTLDVPGVDWLVVTLSKPSGDGDVALLEDGPEPKLRTFSPAIGIFSAAFVGNAEASRLVHSGLAPLGRIEPTGNGLFYAEPCTDGGTPRFGPSETHGCRPSGIVERWGDASGPVAADTAGNVVAVQVSLSAGTQEARIFPAASIAPQKDAGAGKRLFELPGIGSSLAAVAPSGSHPGVAVFQPMDGATFSPLDVVAAPYAASGEPGGEPAPLLELEPGAAPVSVTLLTDADNRLWVGVPEGESRTRFLVLERTP